MNFTSFRNNSHYYDKSLPTTPVILDLCNSEASDITSSIVDSFEKGTFFESHETKLQQFFHVDIKRELDDVLSWLNSDLMPHMKNEATKYDSKNLQECILKAQLIRQKFSEICKFFRYVRQKRHLESHSFTCVTCKKLITLPLHSNLFDNLLQHEHIETRFAYAIEGCTFADNKSDISLPLIMSQGGILPCSSAEETTREKCSLVDNNITKKGIKVGQCCLLADYLADFKFNFEIKYDRKVEQQLYHPEHIEHDVRNIDGLGQPTFQFKTKIPQLFLCLVCCCEIPTYASYRMLKEHIRGHKHTKKKETPRILEAFFSYHDRWMKEEPKYQAHQIHFLPMSVSETICMLCNRLTVPYDLLESHIRSNVHKERFFEVLKKNKLRLLDLQAEVYSEGDCSNNSFASSEDTTNGETDSYLDEMSDDDILLNKSIVIEKTEKGSNVESLRMYTNQHKKENKAGVSKNNFPSNSKVHKETNNLKKMESAENNCTGSSKSQSESTEENSDVNKSKNKYKNHVIVKSVLNEKGTKLEDLLENRLLPHLKVFNKLNDKQIECKSCNVKVQNNIVLVRDHICSKGHQAKSNILNLIYQFHCEICNIVLKDNHAWREHMRMSRHIEKCEKLGASRKTKLTEYECKTCKLVIFGDELSLKRHIGAYGKSAWLRKNREVTLCTEVKSLFKSDHQILDRCFQLVREANQVLLNQEPVTKCCRALEAALFDAYPRCRAFPFGSRVSGLGNEKSDLDVFVDVGDMYLGNANQDARSQEKFVNTACKLFRKRKDEFSHVNPIPTARTPIVQVFHITSKLDCDLSFRHGLSVENTKFLKLCIDVQPVTQPLILILKQWVEYCKLQEHITTYALSMMVIFHLQIIGYLMPVHELRQLNLNKVSIIDGWGVIDFTNLIPVIRDRIAPYTGSPKELLMKFFSYYSSFNYTADVICPLLGQPIKKSLFINKSNGEDLPLEMLAYAQKVSANPDSEQFRARSPFCVQDPFDLSHNLVKACTVTAVEKLKTLCDLTFKHLTSI